MSKPLTPEQQAELMSEIQRVLALSFPQEFAPTRRSGSSSLDRIAEHLEALVEIVRRSTARQIEPYIWQVLEDICDHCPNQNPRCHCPLRHGTACLLYRSIPALIETIAGELVAMKDEDYLRTHPQWMIQHKPFWSHQ